MNRNVAFLLGAGMLITSMLLPESICARTSIKVNTIEDELNSDGDCSLREAIRAANLDTGVDACPAGNGDDLISLSAGTYLFAIPGTGEDAALTGDLDITENVTIQGVGSANTIINANHSDRVFDVKSGASVTLSKIAIEAGVDSGYCGGGIRNQGVLQITECLITGNETSVSGGGLCNDADATAVLDSVEFANNAASNGAAINNVGELEITKSSFYYDSASVYGGGLYNWGTATIVDSSITSETAGDNGGGIYNGRTITLTNTTLNNNKATSGNGGGIYNQYVMTLVNITISANTANSGNGDGIYQWSHYASSLLNVTLHGNSADSGGGIYRDAERNGTLNIKNSIIANSASGGNCAGTITSQGYNLDSGNTCSLDQTGDLCNTDPLLGILADNGGPTLTHALPIGSPAIDTGTNDGCPVTDQRHIARPVGSTCDIGAFEFVQRVFLPMIRYNACYQKAGQISRQSE